MAVNVSFLGQGWAFPPTFSQGGGDVALAAGVEDIHQSLQILLATRPGERIMQEDFGCDLHRFLFEEIDQRLVNALQQVVAEAILDHEPRVDLDDVSVTESANQPGLLLISIVYTVRGTNSRFNLVYPFYINEAAGADLR